MKATMSYPGLDVRATYAIGWRVRSRCAWALCGVLTLAIGFLAIGCSSPNPAGGTENGGVDSGAVETGTSDGAGEPVDSTTESGADAGTDGGASEDAEQHSDSMTDSGPLASEDATVDSGAADGGLPDGSADASGEEAALPDGSADSAGEDAAIFPDAQDGSVEASGPGAPSITEVHISQIGQNIHIEVDGSGFGNAPTTLPAVGELAVFGITDVTAGGWCAGRNGCPVQLQFTSWTNTSIVIDGFGPQYGGPYRIVPGDTVTIFVQGSGTGSTTWTGAIENEAPPPPDPGGPTPRVATVAFSNIGQNMHIEVDGSGFGTAPTTLPAVGELAVFGITDVSAGGWCAGRNGCPVQLQFTSWSDSTIVIDGFGPQYGGADQVTAGDSVSIYVQNSGGPEFMVWTGTLQAGTPPPPDPGGPTPRVATVTFSNIGQNMHIELDGSGFHTAPTTLPAVGELAVFGITDVTAGGWCAGRNGCPVQLQYTSWSDSTIVIDGFGPQYGGADQVTAGDSVSIYVQNSGGPEFMVWTGTLQAGTPPPPDPGGPTPRVASVTFSNVGQDMQIEVEGSGFGNAPTTLPAIGELAVFGITDLTAGGWCAGRNGCPVQLQYTSWSDSTIVIDGFGLQYGGADQVMVGDSVSIYVQNSGGPEFMVWNGTLP